MQLQKASDDNKGCSKININNTTTNMKMCTLVDKTFHNMISMEQKTFTEFLLVVCFSFLVVS